MGEVHKREGVYGKRKLLDQTLYGGVIKREVIDVKELERAINVLFREIGAKYNVRPEVVGTIIAEYSEEMAEKLPRVIVVSEN